MKLNYKFCYLQITYLFTITFKNASKLLDTYKTIFVLVKHSKVGFDCCYLFCTCFLTINFSNNINIIQNERLIFRIHKPLFDLTLLNIFFMKLKNALVITNI